MKLTHESLGISVDFVDELLNKHVDAWMTAMRDFNPQWRSFPFTDMATQYVKAACEAHMLNGLDPEGLGDMKAAEVHWIAGEVDRFMAEALVVPPE
jgi:hypothetical protein